VKAEAVRTRNTNDDRTLSQQIIDQIRDDLLDGVIASGDRLGSEASVAEIYGVSRMAARDALRALMALGIVDMRVGKSGGVFVSQGNLDLLVDAITIQSRLNDFRPAELMESLIAIETIAAELAAQRATEDAVAAISDALAVLRARPESRAAFVSAALRFHETIVLATQNRSLLMQFRALRRLIQPEYERDLTPEVRERIIRSCTKLMTLIVAKDDRGARAQMDRRLRLVQSRGFSWDGRPPKR
jgi:GntR family transcriptional regulator, transcriptional repressor for pyruvate dehydrogenase complex